MKKLSISLTALAASLSASAAFAGDKVVFGTNWLAQGGHGGFYQALADGTYEKYGLEVEIRQGGPQVNNRPMLIAGKLDFLMAGNLLLSFDNVRNGIPTTVVAAIFQKDPQALIAHEGAYESWEDLANAPEILLSKDGQFSYWKWMVEDFGFRDEQVRPYGYNLAQFLSDEKMVQQAYATAEPLYAEAEGADVATYLMADHGWNTYATTIETRQQMIDENPDVVQRFVDASIEGWYTFLYGDHTAGYDAIIEANPELSVEKLDAEMAQVRELGIIDSGDALELGIGAMTDARIAGFYETAVNSGILEDGDLDLSKVADTSFVNKRHGIEIKTAAEGN